MCTEAEKRAAAKQVDAFISILAHRYGLKEDEIPEIVNNLRWVSSSRRGLTRVSWAAVITVIGLGLKGLWVVMEEGIKVLLTK